MESSHHHHLLHQDHHLVGSSTNLLLSSNNIQDTSNIGEDMDCHSWLSNPHYLDAYTKEETKILLESSTKFTDLLTNGNLSRTNQKEEDDLSEKLILKTLLLQSPNNNYHVESPFEDMRTSSNDVQMYNMRSQIHPSVNIPSLVGFHGISSMEDVNNLQPLDLFSKDRSCPQTYSRLQHQNLPSLSNNGLKRSGSKLVEPKPTQSMSKRRRVESRSSCPPFKVRKEKLGDRIAALQQMVSPFSKTDTASVLMEAIGYIKFLQTQVQGLCGKEEEADLRSGGLCLVPLSCVNNIANDGGCDGTWPSNPHNYNPGF